MAIPGSGQLSANDLELIKMGLGTFGGLLSGNALNNSNKTSQLNQLAALIASMQQRQQEDRTQATQLDPLLQQKSRAKFSADGDVMRAAKPATMTFDPSTGFGSVKGGMAIPDGGFSDQTKAFYDPTAMANAEASFYGAANLPYNLPSVGYGDTANTAQQSLAQQLAQNGANDPTSILQQRMNEINGKNPDGTEKHHSGFWSKFGKIAGIAAPIALAPFTGGMSLGMQALIGAGVGAGTGALSGGARGALTGAASGAGSALLAGKLATAGKLGKGATASNNISSPGRYTMYGAK